MFPAKNIIKLDENKIINNLDSVLDESTPNVLGGIRIVGLLKQTECLVNYALDIFHDLTDIADDISNKVSKIENHAASVRKSLKSSISKYNNISDFWDDNQDVINNDIPFSSIKQIVFLI